MRSFEYENLKRFSYQQMVEITAAREPFTILTDAEVGRRIQMFLDTEREFRFSQRSLRDRLRYWLRGLSAVRLSGFMPIWNKAVIEGYSAEVFEADGGSCHVVFARK